MKYLIILLTLLTLGACGESKPRKVIEAKVEILREGGLKDTLVVIEPYELRHRVLREDTRLLGEGTVVAYDVIQVKRIK